MILFELYGAEAHPTYQALAISNAKRHYDFLRSIVIAALAADRKFLSQHVIKALNFHAITCLHTNPGEFRPCEVNVGGEPKDGGYSPPAHYRVQALMDNFVNEVNRAWELSDPVVLAAFVLWKMNYIHPFINGNGRTARAACYFVLCVKLGGLLPGEKILPELLTENRDEYVVALKAADASLVTGSFESANFAWFARTSNPAATCYANGVELIAAGYYSSSSWPQPPGAGRLLSIALTALSA